METIKIISYTNAELKKIASQPGRGHAAVMRIAVDEEQQYVKAQNPVYFLRAYMQDHYQEGMGRETEAAIKTILGEVKLSEDLMKTEDMAGYHFMVGRPYYNDFIEVQGESAKALLETYKKSRDAKKGTQYILELNSDTYVIGYAFDRRTEKFIRKIEAHNELLLPWTIVIEGNKAYAMRADFYVAVSYPLLDLMGFAKIMTLPGAVEEGIEDIFKQ